MNTAWFQKHKTEVILGGGGIVVTIALYMRSKANSAASGSTTATQSSAMPLTTADTTNTDLYDALEGQVQGLSTSVAAVTAANQPKGISASDFSNETATGLGVYSAGATSYTDTSGTTYDVIANPGQLAQYQAAGDQVYYQPIAGTFAPYAGANDTSSTPTQQLVKAPAG